MSRIIRTVSLNTRTDELASKKSNFSAWVRDQLIKDYQAISLTHTNKEYFKKYGICNPGNETRCTICFPIGKPTKEMIRRFNSDRSNAEWRVLEDNKGRTQRPMNEFEPRMEIARNQIQESLKNHYADTLPIIELPISKDVPIDPPKRQRKYVRRFIKWLIEWI
jgi:hypothetical protein